MEKLHFHKEKNFFMEWLLLNDMPTGEITLWHTLMNIGNRLGQKRTFNVPTSTLMKLTGLSKQGLMNARKRLMERGFIRYQKGSHRTAPIYEMVRITEEIELYAAGDQFQAEELSRGDDHDLEAGKLDLDSENLYQTTETKSLSTAVISRKKDSVAPDRMSELTEELTSKLTIHKVKNKKEKRRGGGTRQHVLFDAYEQNMNKLTPITRSELGWWLEQLGEEIVAEALRITVKKGGRTFSYFETILKEWQQARLTSIEQVQDYEQAKEREARRNRLTFRKQSKNKKTQVEQSLEAWLQEEFL